jgi:beta-glucosidase
MNFDRRAVIGGGVALAAAAPLSQARAARHALSRFPKGFLWGAATAAHQVEGNNVNSDTWLLEHVKPTIYAEPSGDAVNSLELWPQDLDLVRQLGLNTYRFSLEWARIEPEPGLFSIAMLDHYKAIVDGCRARGLVPFVTFNHFTTPRWFAMRGAWTNPEAVDLFARFCDRAARHLGGGIGFAATLNEPNLSAVVRNAFPPAAYAGVKRVLEQMSAAARTATGSPTFISGNTLVADDEDGLTRNMIAAHRAGKAAIKAATPGLPVGVTLAMPDDQPLGAGSIRDDIRRRTYGPWLEAARTDDFLGVQNYERTFWDGKGKVEPPLSGGDRNAAGTQIFPGSLANAVRYAHAEARVPIIVTEHGANTDDDAVRARLIPAALKELRSAMADGIPVLGYIHWSLLDNFEWIYGYKYHYGLVAVDRTTFARTPKPSARVLGSIAKRNAL